MYTPAVQYVRPVNNSFQSHLPLRCGEGDSLLAGPHLPFFLVVLADVHQHRALELADVHKLVFAELFVDFGVSGAGYVG